MLSWRTPSHRRILTPTTRWIRNVGTGNIEGVTLSIHPGVEVKGRLVVASDPTMVFSGVRIALGPKEYQPFTAVSSVPTNVDGTFSAASVLEGRYGFMSITGLPADAYVSDMRTHTSIFADGILNIDNSRPAEIQIMISRNGETIDGIVQDSMKKPVGHAAVTLVPDAPGRENSLLYKRVVSGLDGSFTMQGIAPGNYKLFAWESLPSTADENPAFIAAFEQQGVAIRIAAGAATPNVSLLVIPARP
jgi:hypothetical protein